MREAKRREPHSEKRPPGEVRQMLIVQPLGMLEIMAIAASGDQNGRYLLQAIVVVLKTLQANPDRTVCLFCERTIGPPSLADGPMQIAILLPNDRTKAAAEVPAFCVCQVCGPEKDSDQIEARVNELIGGEAISPGLHVGTA